MMSAEKEKVIKGQFSNVIEQLNSLSRHEQDEDANKRAFDGCLAEMLNQRDEQARINEENAVLKAKLAAADAEKEVRATMLVELKRQQAEAQAREDKLAAEAQARYDRQTDHVFIELKEERKIAQERQDTLISKMMEQQTKMMEQQTMFAQIMAQPQRRQQMTTGSAGTETIGRQIQQSAIKTDNDGLDSESKNNDMKTPDDTDSPPRTEDHRLLGDMREEAADLPLELSVGVNDSPGE